MVSRTKKPSNQEPATELMKAVAVKAANLKSLEKTLSAGELEEILAKRDAGETLELAERKALREKYRQIKRQVKEMEKGNKGRIIVMPAITSPNFYKVFDFSALYYVYRLADRMGRSARLMHDSDRNSKMLHSASLVKIDKFLEQMERLENLTPEMTEDGIYIFTLKKELTDEELVQLRTIEETRRTSLHNILKPKKMNPAVFQEILMTIRMVGPRVKKLERHEYYAIGEEMLVDLKNLLRVYYDYAEGELDVAQARSQIVKLVDDLCAGLTVLSELRIWDYGAATTIGEAINEVRRLIVKEFRIKEN